MFEIAAVTAAQIIDNPDRIATVQQQIDHLAADKAGATGNDGDIFRH